jgi:hypothetical protein
MQAGLVGPGVLNVDLGPDGPAGRHPPGLDVEVAVDGLLVRHDRIAGAIQPEARQLLPRSTGLGHRRAVTRERYSGDHAGPLLSILSLARSARDPTGR